MTNTKNIHEQMFDCWNHRDFDGFAALLHPDYTYTAGDGKTHKGGPSVGVNIAKMYAAALPDGVVTITNTHTTGNTIITEFVARGTHGGPFMGIPATGNHVEIPICNVVELKDGKIFREREYMDTAEIFRQIGVEHDLAPRAQQPSSDASQTH